MQQQGKPKVRGKRRSQREVGPTGVQMHGMQGQQVYTGQMMPQAMAQPTQPMFQTQPAMAQAVMFQPTPQQFQVICQPGYGQGSMMPVQLADGRQVMVAVP